MLGSLSKRVSELRPSATLAMAQAARELKAAGIDVMTLSAGEPDFNTPKAICEVAKAAIDAGKHHYSPICGNNTLISAMREKFERDQHVGYNADEVMATVGAKSAILLALNALINEGDEVILCAPYWVSYEAQVELAGGRVVIVQCSLEDNFMPTKEALKKAITPKTKALILNSPNNPSGAVISKEQLEGIAEVLHTTGIWLISDEIYERLLFDGAEHISPARLSPDMRERTIVISGASKAYAMTGWRLGVVAGHKKIIAAMAKLQGQETTCLPEFIQEAGAFAFRENADVKLALQSMLKAYTNRRDRALEIFKEMPGVSAYKPQGAFYIWADFNAYVGKEIRKKLVKDDIDLAERILREAHVATVPGGPFGGGGYLRLSIASSYEDIEKALFRIRDWLVQR
jgi:aspartate aminotransferase